jgi:hypothetical protein
MRNHDASVISVHSALPVGVLMLLVAGLLAGCDALSSNDTADPPPVEEQEPPPSLTPSDGIVLTVNNHHLGLSDAGHLAYPVVTGEGGPGAWYPEGAVPEIHTLFQGGLWLAARQNGALRANIAGAGINPLSNYRVLRDTVASPPDTTAALGVFKATRDTLRQDSLQWPRYAPTDAQGEPRLLGDAMVWGAFTSNHDNYPAEIRPLDGLRVQQVLYGYDDAGLRDVLFTRYALTNTSSDPLTKTYVGFRADIDLHTACTITAKNVVGYDAERAITYTYPHEARADSISMGCPVSVVGYVLLETPNPGGVTTHRIVNKDFPGGYTEDIETPQEVHYALRGLSNEGDPMTNPVTGEETKFAFTGDPVRRTGWLDYPKDVRSLLGAGPFALEQGETTVLTVALVAARGETLEAALGDVRAKVERVRSRPDLWRFD